jgi:hypothetical protein
MSQKTHIFSESLQVGSDGEKIIESLIQILKPVEKVENVTQDPYYRSIDVDFVVTTRAGDRITYELKTEPTAYHTGNFFYEHICNVDKNTAGCFLFSEADFWMTFIPQSGLLYIFPLEKYREYVLEETKNLPLLNVYNKGKLTKGKILKIKNVCANMSHNIKNLRDYVDYDYVEAVRKSDGVPSAPAKFKNVCWKRY